MEKSHVGIIVKGKNVTDGMEDFNRPSHPDFMTAKELKDMKFSGTRHNSLVDSIEIWTTGDLRGSIGVADATAKPELLEALYAHIFSLAEVKLENPR